MVSCLFIMEIPHLVLIVTTTEGGLHTKITVGQMIGLVYLASVVFHEALSNLFLVVKICYARMVICGCKFSSS